jgi:hypothetical protein
MAKCVYCAARTISSTGLCQKCKSARHHGFKRIRNEDLIVDEAGGAWWVWTEHGEVLVVGRSTKQDAIVALGRGEQV